LENGTLNVTRIWLTLAPSKAALDAPKIRRSQLAQLGLPHIGLEGRALASIEWLS
jgi:hypothetical protein